MSLGLYTNNKILAPGLAVCHCHFTTIVLFSEMHCACEEESAVGIMFQPAALPDTFNLIRTPNRESFIRVNRVFYAVATVSRLL